MVYVKKNDSNKTLFTKKLQKKKLNQGYNKQNKSQKMQT
jgi:hypothetical protein